MKFDPHKHHRGSNRLQGYDYSLAGAYFITVVTYQREMLFGEIVEGGVKLNRRGEIVWEEWFASTNIRKEIRLFSDEFVVMPNHIHGIVWIVNDGSNANAEANAVVVGADGRPLRRKPRSLSSFVAGFKASVTKRIRDELNETGIWQRNYHDRIIRNERELDATRRYILANPLDWVEDGENPRSGR
jgi:putative transposase